jgi:deoxycytidylate deaminase
MTVLAKSDLTMADILKNIADELELKVKPIEEVKKQGYEEARKLFMVTFPCDVCGKPVAIIGPRIKQIVSDYIAESEYSWGHKKCHEQKDNG